MPLRAALDVARQAAGLALEVEAQRQRVQVAEDLERDAADRALRDLREDRVAQLAEGLRQDAGHAVGEDQRDRHRHGRAVGSPSASTACL